MGERIALTWYWLISAIFVIIEEALFALIKTLHTFTEDTTSKYEALREKIDAKST